MSNYPLSIQNLTKRFESFAWFGKKPKTSFTAVDDVSFDLKPGEILGFLGPNGAGKTTTIQMLLNLITPTAGSIHYFGKELRTSHSTLQHVSYASSYMRLPGMLTVRQSLIVHGLLYDIPYKQLKHGVDQAITEFGIEHLAHKETSTLSAGQTTSVLLARAFLVKPKIVLLDEPTASLDPDTAQRIRTLIAKQNKQFGISILFTSHNMPEVAELCDRILVLKQGAIVADNTPENLASSVSIARVQLMVGDGLKRTIDYATQNNLTYKVEERSIEIEIDEHKIAQLLASLAQTGVSYSQISIEKPTLEDYFLTLVKKGTV